MDKNVLVFNTNRPIRPLKARYCESFTSRLRGFTFRRQIGEQEGLVLVERRDSRLDTAIHMLFVWTDLAVVWIDGRQQVVDTVLARAWRPAYLPARPARYVLELSPGRLADFQVGDLVEFIPNHA